MIYYLLVDDDFDEADRATHEVRELLLLRRLRARSWRVSRVRITRLSA